MEASLPIPRSFSFRTSTRRSKIVPFTATVSNGRFSISLLSSLGCKEFPANMITSLITASADYPRRRPRRISNSRPTPKGFTPKIQVGTSTHKRDQSDSGEQESSGPSSSNEYAGPASKFTETKAKASEEQKSDVVSETSPSGQLTTKADMLREAEEQTVETEDEKDITPSIGKGLPSVKSYDVVEKEILVKTDENKAELGGVELPEKSSAAVGTKPVVTSDVMDEVTDLGGQKVLVNKEINFGKDPVAVSDDKYAKSTTAEIGKSKDDLVEPKLLKQVDAVADREPYMEEELMKGELEMETQAHNENLMRQKREMEVRAREQAWRKQRLIMEARAQKEVLKKQKLEMEARARKQLLENLAEQNFLMGNKLFVNPQVLKPEQRIEVFLNRSLSTLKGEPDVLIMGAFNDWRWKSFSKNMQKTDLKGDWWSCKVFVPKEAYKMDFVFFNGGDVYENNSSKDFFLPVEGGMDVSAFEDFLLEEKRRELERLAAEEAESKRRADEQRRLEAEKVASEADRAQAKKEVEKRREILLQIMQKAERSVDNVWYIEPSDFKGEDMVKLYYNRSSGPLSQAEEVWIHGGYNNWSDGVTIVQRLAPSEEEAGDWLYADVLVPRQSVILDWVFADGPPGSAKVYDNNNFQDFRAAVPNSILEDLYWAEKEKEIYRRLQEERRQREDAIRAKAEKTKRMKAETREKTMRMFLLSQKHIVYTEPLAVRAGTTVTVFYNPSNTVLNGKKEVWFRCSFNRWTHHSGPLPPQKMTPAENGSHVKVTVKVPLDAYMIDFVFSEKEEGGIYDNKNGMDYHIPVVGGVTKAPPMNIVHIAVEMAPIAKVGGLGDVVTSLSRAVQDLGHSVDIILPKYDCMNLSNVKDFQFNQSYGWGGTEIKVWHGKVEGLSAYFIEPQNGMFSVGCIYGCRNDGERFGFFCHAALEFLLQSGAHPDILHCHDWSSAPVAWLFKDHYTHYGLSGARVVFTIHNLEFGASKIGKAATYSDKATTVSPNYSREVSGNSVIAPHLHKFHGILNGIDPDIWDPYNDNFLPISYTSENVVEGKRAAKVALQQRLGLRTSDHPLVGIISRLTHQKGIHLIKHAIWRTLERNGQVVLLGSAPDPRIQNDFVNLANHLHSSHADRARLCLTYDEPLSHLIYAGSDFILVPSIFEPCGLTQLIAMRYGSIPVVRKTGGLYDTVFDVDHDKERAQAVGIEPNGFSFDGADSSGVDYALNRAISAWYDGPEWFNSLCKCVMEQDWSWNRPALDYMELYYAARK